jgi:hypothetical protein
MCRRVKYRIPIPSPLLIDIHLLDALGKRGVEHGGIARALRDAALRHVGRFEPGGEILPPQPIQAIEIKRFFRNA